MQTRTIAGMQVSAIGLGCMSISSGYGVPPPVEQGEQVVQAALDAGVTLFDTAALYGFGKNETLVGRVLKAHRDEITLCSKGGMAAVQFPDGLKRVINGRPEAIRLNCEDSLRRLQTDVIDLYYLHRWDKQVPIEDSVGEMARLVAEGKVRALGLSEVSAPIIRRAHAVHAITAVQTEYSLWTRNPEIAVLATCREIDATFVAFSPLARAFLTDALHDVSALAEKDLRRAMPRFAPDTYARNLALLPAYCEVAREVGCSPAQLALAWLLAQGEQVVTIPGTSRIDHLEDNMGAAQVSLTPAQVQRLDALINRHTVVGPRYNPASQADVDTENFAD